MVDVMSPLRAAAALCLLACGSGPTVGPLTPAAAEPGLSTPTAAPSVLVPEPTVGRPLPEPVHHDPAELDPARATERAPDLFRARFATTQGEFVIEVRRSWAPNGADRFYNLIKLGVYDDTRFFRAINGFMVQFGISGDPQVATPWRVANFPDDPVMQSNQRAFVTFAQTGAPNSRSTQVFVNYRDNVALDRSGFAPFGRVVDGMNVVDSLYQGYGEGAPGGDGPDQSRIQLEGNAYLDREFPKLDRILRTEVIAP
jgi:peptidyl-prolyl cis-trans isomerase A (cyclophilin A)